MRCSGEHRIAVYKGGRNVRNYALTYGANDVVMDGSNILILTAYSEWPIGDGRHLQEIAMATILKGLE